MILGDTTNPIIRNVQEINAEDSEIDLLDLGALPMVVAINRKPSGVILASEIPKIAYIQGMIR